MRILLTSSAYPFLSTETGATLRWSEGARLRMLYMVSHIEIAPRGVRVLYAQHAPRGRRWNTPTACSATTDGLCASNQSLLFPSPPIQGSLLLIDDANRSSALMNGEGPFIVTDPKAAGAHLTDPLAQAYALADQCVDHGVGRAFVDPAVDPWMYTVTACDAMEGHMVALWSESDATVRLSPQTFGPMAYCVMLLQAVLCMYFATSIASFVDNPKSAPQYASGSAVFMVVSCFLLDGVHGVPFVTSSDANCFWISGLFALYLSACAVLWGDASQAGEACVHALGTMACAVYRTPENAYAGLLALILAVRLWDKLLQWERWLYHASGAKTIPEGGRAWAMGIECVLSAPVLLCCARVGLATQFDPPARWPFFAGVAAYISFAFSLQRSIHGG